MTNALHTSALIAALALAGCAAAPSSNPQSAPASPDARAVAPGAAPATPATVAPSPPATAPAAAATPTPGAVAPRSPPMSEQSPAARGLADMPEGLGDLDAMTFACVKAGLNAAAREAGKAPAQGRYQFSYFRIVDASHQAMYEVHFKSNYHGEPDLKYCVALYCQQGIDPRTAKTSISLVGDKAAPRASRAAAMGHAADCSELSSRSGKGHAKR